MDQVYDPQNILNFNVLFGGFWGCILSTNRNTSMHQLVVVELKWRPLYDLVEKQKQTSV